MRIRTRLFLGTALIVLALLGVQWWLQQRHLKAIEDELTQVAMEVGAHFVYTEKVVTTKENQKVITHEVNVRPAPENEAGITWVPQRREPSPPEPAEESRVDADPAAPGMTRPDPGSPTIELEADRIWLQSPADMDAEVNKIISRNENVRVITDKHKGNKILVISGLPAGERRVPIPVSRAADIVQETWRQNLLAAGILLLLGLAGAALMAHRVTQPVRQLTVGADRLGQGQFGAQVPVTSRGEMGELQTTFNTMSRHLADLEREKEAWQARAHLAELGGLARGLAHTLRNPLNTLGLIIEEMARSDEARRTNLAQSARGQIRRIDGWLRSFLAVDTDGRLRAIPTDLHSLARDVVFEAVQAGGQVEIRRHGDIPPVKVVAPALRSALANLVENAVEASPPEKPVRVELSATAEEVVIRVIDQGAGLPEEIRARLFTPHVTTKSGGAGMGIFLARQLVEAGHGGRLLFSGGEKGGTVATVTLPLYTSEEKEETNA